MPVRRLRLGRLALPVVLAVLALGVLSGFGPSGAGAQTLERGAPVVSSSRGDTLATLPAGERITPARLAARPDGRTEPASTGAISASVSTTGRYGTTPPHRPSAPAPRGGDPGVRLRAPPAI